MSQLSAKSQDIRKPFCRYCYIPMMQHGVLDLVPVFGTTDKKPKKEPVNYDWICEKCGYRPNPKKEALPS